MATLYDLELLESNNFIHMFLTNGTSPSLRLLREQKEMAVAMGEIGEKIIHDLGDPSTDIGKSYKRLEDLEGDMRKVMKKVGIAAEEVEKADAIFKRSPESLDSLNEDEHETIQGYWLKKKECIAELTALGYTFQELFS